MPASFDSGLNTEHHYKVIEHVGEGGQGSVSVAFKYDLDDRALGIVACKFIKQSYIDLSRETREAQLEREIQNMTRSDPMICSQLHEVIRRDGVGVILVMDYANGLSLNQLLNIRYYEIPEPEAREIIKLLSYGLASLKSKEIMHRDININNVVLHFPSQEPTEQDLLDPRDYYNRLKVKIDHILRTDLMGRAQIRDL